ncbi:MAG: hypothetical protein ACI4ON_04925 [Clostridia bacterium]
MVNINKEYERLEELKIGLENNNITAEDISDNDLPLINAILQYEIFLAQDKLEKTEGILSEYKQRMLNAIDYLKNKNSNNY